ncbi:1422_t:CDS:10 [Entrophospora sp. SA101]|nr:1422_t:CDS:10 [Entrophospora sp. SA101]
MRYGHSEVSNEYPIIDNNGQVMVTLTLNDLSRPGLLENFDVPTLALSISSQRQEQVDPFYSDMMRNYKFSNGDIADIASLDGVRSRDRGIPLYNEIRTAYNFKPATDWSDITNNTVIQTRLKQLYTSVDNVEALVGALAEDHLPGSNLGPLIRKSMIDQFTAIRDSDRFYYESPGSGWSLDEINQINNITWRDIITRNVPQFTLPTNIWFVQPSVTFGTTNIFDSNAPDYPSSNYLRLSDVYEIRWKIVGDGNTGHLQLLLTMLSVNSWFGLGFNSIDNGMLGADFIVLRNSNDGQNIEVGNYKSAGYQPPMKDVNNQYVEVLNQKFVNFTTQVELRRPLIASDTKPINDKLTTMIYAWNPGSNVISYHGGNRGSIKVNFFTATILQQSESKNHLTRLLHGLAMFVIWAILFPISVFIVRYWKHTDKYLFQHRNLQIVGGFLSLWGLARLESANKGIMKGIRAFHFVLGSALIAFAWVNIYFGITQYQTYSDAYNGVRFGIWQIIYLIWIGLLCIGFICGEYWYNYRNGVFFWNTSDPEDNQHRIESLINGYNKLPDITWDDVNQRVASGAHLVVAEGIVFDIRKWICNHPGGAKILKRVIGTDITQDFFHDKSKIQQTQPIQKPINKNLIIQSNNDAEKLLYSRAKVATIDKYENYDDADFVEDVKVDQINAKTSFNNKISRVAIHSHSKFAATKLATMAIAKLLKNDHLRNNRLTFLPSSQYNNNNISYDNTKIYDNTCNPNIFRRYILVRKETLNIKPDVKRCPVRRFTFQTINPDDQTLPNFQPGDYMEFMTHTKGQVIIRPYTTLQEKGQGQENSNKSFSIIVKIYENGLMSRHLDKQLIGFEIKVRGPFDISTRDPTSAPLTSATLLSPKFFKKDSPPSPSFPLTSPSLSSPPLTTNILLNPLSQDGCWDVLFMICGGTGLTPMLQLINHHFDEAISKPFKLFLLFANNTLPDVFNSDYLELVATNNKDRFKVSYILTRPPPKWEGFTGHINERTLIKWMKSCHPMENHNEMAFGRGIIDDDNNIIYNNGGYANNVVVCGPPIMMESVESSLIEKLKFNSDKVIFIR